MAELVNQRIEGMINEFEQMQRISLYSPEEVREISRRRTEFEYKIQRRTKHKEDFIHYIAYDIALLEDISLRRRKINVKEKKNEIEYTIARRVVRIFKQFIERFKEDIEVYFQYIQFCKSVGFDYAIAAIIAQMLQIHGDRPKMWLMASRWESDEMKNLESARSFLLKGIHRHPNADFLYLELFDLELRIAAESEDQDVLNKQIQKVDVISKTALKSTGSELLLSFCDISLKYECAKPLTEKLKEIIWEKSDQDNVLFYIAKKGLQEIYWPQVEDNVTDIQINLPKKLKYYIAVNEDAIRKSCNPQKLFRKYIHDLLSLTDNECKEKHKLEVVKRALMFGHDEGLMDNDLYEFWLDVINTENYHTSEEIRQIIEEGIKKVPSCKCLWEVKIKMDHLEEQMSESTLVEAGKHLTPDDIKHIWSIFLELVNDKEMINKIQKKIINCENELVLCMKPKLLSKCYNLNGLKSARKLFEELVITPPLQLEVYTEMVTIEKEQDVINKRLIRKLYEGAIQHFGKDNIDLWHSYMNFEVNSGDPKFSAAIYQRAVATLKKELVDKFIKENSLARLK